MKKTILWTGGVIAILNLLVGMIVTSYAVINITVTTAIILLTIIIMLDVNGCMHLRDGFKVSLNFLIPMLGIIQYFFALFMPHRIQDNWYLITILIILAFEVIILISAKFISKKIR